MAYSNLVITAGISALAPRNFLGEALRAPDSPLTFQPGRQNPEARDGTLSPDALESACREFLAPVVAAKSPDPRCVSAEFSLLNSLHVAHRLGSGALVHLIHTPTLAGQLAVALQKSLLEQCVGVQVDAVELSVPFDPGQPGGLALASGAFIGTVSRLLRYSDPHTTAFAPIGGYKVMVALGHTAASFHRFPSLYLHEDTQVLQEIAPAPLAIPEETRTELGRVARHVGNGAEWKGLSPHDQTVIDRHPAFFCRVDDLVELNELGQFLRLDSLPILLAPGAEEERRQQPAIIDAQIRQIAAIASTNPEHESLNHNLVSAKGGSYPWRLARMGNGIRHAWQITDDHLLIGGIWRDHDAYEKEAPSWIQRPLASDTSSFVSFS